MRKIKIKTIKKKKKINGGLRDYWSLSATVFRSHWIDAVEHIERPI